MSKYKNMTVLAVLHSRGGKLNIFSKGDTMMLAPELPGSDMLEEGYKKLLPLVLEDEPTARIVRFKFVEEVE